MSHCFGGSSNLSAKDYINKKRNLNMFCDLRKRFIGKGYKVIGTNDACLTKDGIIKHFRNSSIKLNIMKGYENFSVDKRSDASKNYIGEKIKEEPCRLYNKITNNVDVSNNYTYRGPQNTLVNNTDETFQSKEYKSIGAGSFINTYAEIKKTQNISSLLNSDGNFKSNKKILYTNCPLRDSKMIQVVLPENLPTPIIISYTLVFI